MSRNVAAMSSSSLSSSSSSSSSSSWSSSVVVVVLTTVSIFVVSPAVVHGQDLVHGKVREGESDTPATTLLTTGPRGNLPSSLNVDVPLGGQQVHLHLARDRGFNPGLPVYVLSLDSHGGLQSRRARLNDTEFAVYQDVQNEGAFGVFREKDANGSFRYKLQGIVHSQGLLYNLQSAIHLKPRHRRNAVDDNDVSNSSTSHDDDDDDDDGVDDAGGDDHGGGIGDDGAREVFEVTVLPQTSADGSDSLRPPASSPERKLMQEDPAQVASLPSLPASPSAAPLPPLPDDDSPLRKKRRRRKRQGEREVYVDVVAVVDYGAYKAWYDRTSGIASSQRQQTALQYVRQYYAIVMNGVDLLYKGITGVSYRINVRLVALIVSTSAGTSSWTERYRVSGARWDSVDAQRALEALKTWVGTTDLLPAYDHVMLFTGYDLSKTVQGVFDTGITGLAYTGTLCDMEGQAVSIVEDLGGFQCIATAAHELGHGLSAEHDGVGNVCRSEDRYVMAAGTYSTTPQNKLNPWRFSFCSVNYFTTFLRDTAITTRGHQCLYTALAVSSDVPDASSVLPGQLYDPDEQCRQVYGPQSRLCRGPEFGEASDVCTAMFCFDPSTSSICVKLVAARGTTCGSQKWCKSGQCVADAAAPIVDASCVFGDQPGTAFQGLDCVTFVNRFPGYCYENVVRQRCCGSCSRHYRLVTDCEYGDKARGCDAGSCPYGDLNYRQQCCGTCNHGTTFTTTPDPTLPVRPGLTTSAACVDSPTFTFNMMTCPALVAQQPEACYDVTVARQCCRSCRAVSTGVAGCEYGDRDPSQCLGAQSGSNTCSTLQSLCCRTCASEASSSTVVVVAADVLLSCLLVAVVSLRSFG